MKYFDIANDVTTSVLREHLGIAIVNPECKFEEYDADDIDIAEICIKIEERIANLGMKIDIGYEYNTNSRVKKVIENIKTNLIAA